MRILCLGISHKTADVALRERLALDSPAVEMALRDLSSRWEKAEFVILSTCNRTELYVARPIQGHPRDGELEECLGRLCSVPVSQFQGSLYTLRDGEAAGHLFAVAAGLDSMVPGEDQIVGQMKDAYAAAVKASTARGVMNELFQTAFHAGKHIRSETEIAQGKVSVASVAVDCVGKVFPTLTGKVVLNIGAGKMSEVMLRQIAQFGAEVILVANRSMDAARELAAACGGVAVPLRAVAEHLWAADVVLTCTSSPTPLITRQMVETAQHHRGWRPLLIVDIAVPRDVEEDVRELENVRLYNIDDLQEIVRSTLSSRHGQRGSAQKIIDEHVRELMQALSARGVAPTIDALYRRMKAIADEELSAARRALAAHSDAEDDEKVLQRALHRTIRRILHTAAKNLREEAGSDVVRAHVAAIRKLFQLEE
jgi:glutamyl-tRNA reductase